MGKVCGREMMLQEKEGDGNYQVNECCSDFPGWSVGKLINYLLDVKGLYK